MKPGSIESILEQSPPNPSTLKGLKRAPLNTLEVFCHWLGLGRAQALLTHSSMAIKQCLNLLLCLSLIHSSVYSSGAMANSSNTGKTTAPKFSPIPDFKSPQGKPVYLDVGPHAISEKGTRVFAETANNGFLNGTLKNGEIKWENGETTKSLRAQNTPKGKIQSEFPEKYLPSKIGNELKWTSDDRKAAKERVRKMRSGEFWSHQMEGYSAKGALKAPIKGTLNAGAGVAAFYAALGIAAAFTLAVNYSSDPRAWDAFLETFTTPEGALIIGGFGVAAGSVYLARRAAGRIGVMGYNQGLGTFMGMIGVGAIAATAITNIVTHPRYKECLGFDLFDKGGFYKINLLACDEIAKTLELRKLADDVIPVLLSSFVAGGVYYGISYSTSILIRNSPWFKTLLEKGQFLIQRIPGGNPLSSGVRLVGGMLIIVGLMTVVHDVLGFGEMVNKIRRTSHSFQYDTYGATWDKNFNLIASSLAALQQNPYEDPKWNEVCVDSWFQVEQAPLKLGPLNLGNIAPKAGTGRELVNCYNSEIQYLPGLLRKYHDHSTSWRGILFSKSIEKFESYAKKTNSVYLKSDLAYGVYYSLISRMIREKEKGIILLSEKYLSQKAEENQELSSAFPDWSSSDNFSAGTTQNSLEYVLASMVCGPEASETERLVVDSSWYDIQFNPPKVTVESRTLNKDKLSLCQHPGVKNFPVELAIKELKEKIDPRFLQADGLEQFQKWWSLNVTQAIRNMETKYKGLYKDVLTGTYLPAMTNQKLYMCSGVKNTTPLTGFLKTYEELGGSFPCGPDNMFQVYEGVQKSIEEDIRFQLAILSTVFATLRQAPNASHKEFNAIAKEIMNLNQDIYTELNQLGKGSETVKKIGGEYVPRYAESHAKMVRLFAYARFIFKDSPSSEYLLQTGTQALDNMGKTFAEIETYMKVLTLLED